MIAWVFFIVGCALILAGMATSDAPDQEAVVAVGLCVLMMSAALFYFDGRAVRLGSDKGRKS